MPRTTARALSQLINSGTDCELYSSDTWHSSRRPTARTFGTETFQGGTSFGDGTSTRASFEFTPSPVARSYRHTATRGARSGTPEELRTPSRHAGFGAFQESPVRPSTAIRKIAPRFTVQPPLDSAQRAAVSPASPPLLPPDYRTQASLSEFIDDGLHSTTWPSARVNRTLFPEDGYSHYSVQGTWTAYQKQQPPTYYGPQTQREIKFQKMLRKHTSCCSYCGSLGHRWHMDWCRWATAGSASSIGYVKCYKTR
mmetsp:Transcript_9063/g.26017  ORF Transcript_9063/g.26017 Transcript_9063/m.26017 type:complete len:254 (+) Transcript_9063:272-1033(+)